MPIPGCDNFHAMINIFDAAPPGSIKTLAFAPGWSLRSAQTPKITNAQAFVIPPPPLILRRIESLDSIQSFTKTGELKSSVPSNSKFNYPETEKRPEKYAGFPAGWEKAGPLPFLFLTATPSTLCGSLFGPLLNGSAVKKEKWELLGTAAKGLEENKWGWRNNKRLREAQTPPWGKCKRFYGARGSSVKKRLAWGK
ncbi:MAG: hypothetical protein LBU19_11630, partial [Treponema sp.]|nr:hypothetical protein [Treponema sp.]